MHIFVNYLEGGWTGRLRREVVALSLWYKVSCSQASLVVFRMFKLFMKLIDGFKDNSAGLLLQFDLKYNILLILLYFTNLKKNKLFYNDKELLSVK